MSEQSVMKNRLFSRLKSWLLSHIGVVTASATGRCDCKGDTQVDLVGFVEQAYLQSGQHTNFGLMRCRRCKRLTGFPNDNMTLALEQGTPRTKAELMNLSDLPVPLPIAYSYVLGGVSACSPEIYRQAMDEIAALCRRKNDDIFRAEVREYEKTLPCDID